MFFKNSRNKTLPQVEVVKDIPVLTCGHDWEFISVALFYLLSDKSSTNFSPPAACTASNKINGFSRGRYVKFFIHSLSAVIFTCGQMRCL